MKMCWGGEVWHCKVWCCMWPHEGDNHTMEGMSLGVNVKDKEGAW